MVSTILGGAKAMRDAAQTYLPKFPQERDKDYQYRRSNAKFTNIYRDIVENLAQRPFSKEVSIADGAPKPIKDFVEDVDGQGNHLHVFAGELFFGGINNAVEWLLIDYSKDVPANATRADEARIGARPYWVHIPAPAMLAVYSDMVDGKEQFVHARIHEPALERDGFGEKTYNRVRVLNRDPLDGGGYAPATYQVFEEQKGKDGALQWVSIDGPKPISIGIIPLVPFITGRRIGRSWRFHPPMQDAAFLQVEHFQQESALKHAKALTAFPMLAGNGVTPPMGDNGKPAPVAVGPASVLWAPANPNGGSAGSWAFVEPSATSLRFLADDIKETGQALRELGRQPLTAQSGNLTVVTTAFAAQKGNAAIQAWALNLKDALEQAFVITGRWLKIDADVEVMISTDFDLGMGDDETFVHVLAMGTGEAPIISREATISEAKRRNILSPEYDGDKDLAVIIREGGEDE
ncbi:DUF4055 domain-containing protein [Salipiger marinus]